jgi:hypothetical protein
MNQIALQVAIRTSVGEHEDGPPFANRGPRIDRWNEQAGAPLSSPWCASAAAMIWRVAGCELPPTDAASCDAWHQWLVNTKRWVPRLLAGGSAVPDVHIVPEVGWVVLYNFEHSSFSSAPPIAHHMGVVFDVLSDRFLVGEGNTSASPTDREGWIYLLKERRFTDPGILGYGMPEPRA